MIIFCSDVSVISRFEINCDDKELLNIVYDMNDTVIIDYGNGKFLTKKMIIDGKEPADLRVKYNLQIFQTAKNIVSEYGSALAVDENNQYCGRLLYDTIGHYEHEDNYDGKIDMSFLDEYECLYLHDCNEYSMVLCQNALKMWKGSRIILTGENWDDFLGILAPILNVDVYFNNRIINDFSNQYYSSSLRCLHVKNGFPYRESMERYKNGIMYYDEIMSITYLFSNLKVSHNGKNKDTIFFVINIDCYNLGLFVLFSKVSSLARYAKAKGFVPYIQLTKTKSFYQDNREDIYEKFFNQPEGYTWEEIKDSMYIVFSPFFYIGSIQQKLIDSYMPEIKLSWSKGIYNDKVQKIIYKQQKSVIKFPDRTLGILARGTDYANGNDGSRHIHAKLGLLFEKANEIIKKKNYQFIYLSTEDAEYLEYFKKRYGDKLIYTNQERYTIRNDETLYMHHMSMKNKRAGFLMGMDYILSIECLAICAALVASGPCGGTREAIKKNGGKYEVVYVFDINSDYYTT